MKRMIFILAAAILLSACSSKKAAANLPKDASLKPVQDTEKLYLQNLWKEIQAEISKVPCTDAAGWRIAPIGSKPCGGPAAYIAYPKKDEEKFSSMIARYTELSTAYNKKHELISDCAMVEPPSGVRCENGKAVLTGGNSAAAR